MALNIRIVLIKTWHSGNIGAAARAMKNMGLSDLVLVDPVDYPSDEATSRAGKATDILESARIVHSLEEAIADCSLVIGTSARNRSIALPSLSPEQCAIKATAEAQKSPVAIVFGRERMGLHNDEIQQCHFQLNIDANPEYPVLNLSQAVQLACYEIFKANQTPVDTQEENEYPLHNELEMLYKHLEDTAFDTNFLNKSHPGQTMAHLRAMFRRARPTKKELSLLRGFLSSIHQQKSSDPEK